MLSHTFTKVSIAIIGVSSGLATAKPGVDQYILDLENSNFSGLFYPTQFTQSIVPKSIHSHNDCGYSSVFSVLRQNID